MNRNANIHLPFVSCFTIVPAWRITILDKCLRQFADRFPNILVCVERHFGLRFLEAYRTGMLFEMKASNPKSGARDSRETPGLVKLRMMSGNSAIVQHRFPADAVAPRTGVRVLRHLRFGELSNLGKRRSEICRHLRRRNESAARSSASITGSSNSRTGFQAQASKPPFRRMGDPMELR